MARTPDAPGSLVVADAERRAQTLARLQLLEGVPPESFRRLTRLAAYVAGGEETTIAAAVHLLDARHQHRVSSAGGPPLEASSLVDSLCARVVALDRPVFTSDVTTDTRLAGTTWTTKDEPLRFYVGIPLRVEHGGTVGTLCLFDTRPHGLNPTQRDLLLDLADEVAEQLAVLALTHELGHDATHDALTGLANRVLLSQRLTLAMSRRERAADAPTLALIDLDRFKAVNDVHGHAVGDEVLISTARRLLERLRPEDLLARVGGDEFAVLVDGGLDDDAVAGLADRLREVASSPHDTAAGPVQCGFSVGLARARPGELGYELLGRADADLYASKGS